MPSARYHQEQAEGSAVLHSEEILMAKPTIAATIVTAAADTTVMPVSTMTHERLRRMAAEAAAARVAAARTLAKKHVRVLGVFGADMTVAAVAANPKKSGSKEHAKFGRIEVGMTVKELRKLGYNTWDLTFETNKGYLTLVS